MRLHSLTHSLTNSTQLTRVRALALTHSLTHSLSHPSIHIHTCFVYTLCNLYAYYMRSHIYAWHVHTLTLISTVSTYILYMPLALRCTQTKHAHICIYSGMPMTHAYTHTEAYAYRCIASERRPTSSACDPLFRDGDSGKKFGGWCVHTNTQAGDEYRWPNKHCVGCLNTRTT